MVSRTKFREADGSFRAPLASDLFIELLGESARHMRAAIGVSALPHNALVELQMTVAI